MFISIFFFITSFLISYLSLRFLIPIFKKKWLVYPIKRSSHKTPTPVGGGIVFFLVSAIFSLFNYEFTPLLCLPVFLIGHIDDIRGLSIIKRLWIQVGTGLLVFLYQSKGGVLSQIDLFDFSKIIYFLIIFLFIFIFTSVVNISNFADGLDGLLASTIFIIFLTILIKEPDQKNIIFILGPLLGFLIWNWYPAKVFMGDSGSYYLGAYYGSIIFNSNNLEQVVSFLLLATPIFADISITIFRRFFRGDSIFKAHKLFLFHRLEKSGLKHSKITCIYLLATLLLCLSYLLGGIIFLIIGAMFTLLLGIYLDQKIAVSF